MCVHERCDLEWKTNRGLRRFMVFACARMCVSVCVCMFIPRENANGGNYDALALVHCMQWNRVSGGVAGLLRILPLTAQIYQVSKSCTQYNRCNAALWSRQTHTHANTVLSYWRDWPQTDASCCSAKYTRQSQQLWALPSHIHKPQTSLLSLCLFSARCSSLISARLPIFSSCGFLFFKLLLSKFFCCACLSLLVFFLFLSSFFSPFCFLVFSPELVVRWSGQ